MPFPTARLTACLLALSSATALQEREPDAPHAASAADQLSFVTEPLGGRALWFDARASAEDPAAESSPLVEALRAFAADGGAGTLRSLDARVLAAPDADAVAGLFEGLPETAPGPGGTVALRERALALAARLTDALRDRSEEEAVQAATRAEAAWSALTAALEPSGGLAACLQRAAAWLELDSGAESTDTLRFHPVWRAPRPGAMTARTTRGPVSVVGFEGLEPAASAEVVVHEALHQLEARAASRDGSRSLHAGLPLALDEALARGGLSPRQRRDATHALLFYAAAEALRRLHDPEHVDHGERRETYTRFPAFHPTLRALFLAWTAGELEREAFLAGAVDAVLGERRQP